MQYFFKEAIRINQMDNTSDKEIAARLFFEKLNEQEIPEYFNWVTEVFEGIHVRHTPDKTALVWQNIDDQSLKRSYTYQDLSDNGNRLLNLLTQKGVAKGDNMYMMTPIVPEIWFASLACIKGGIVSVPTAAIMTVRELQFRFEVYPPDAVIADEASAVLIEEALEKAGVTPKVKIVLTQRPGWDAVQTIESFDTRADAARTSSADILFCFFTSGTTGLPKRVGHTVTSYPIGHLSTTLMIGLTPEDIHNNLSAPGWAKWSWSSFFAAFNVGATVTGFAFSTLDAERYLYAVEQNRVTSFCSSPTAWRMFIAVDPVNFDLSCLRQSLSAGEPLNTSIIDAWEQISGTSIRDFYGQTETTAMIGQSPWMVQNSRKGSLGSPSGMYDVALADPEGHLITQPGKTGHIVIKLDQWHPKGLFSEYMGDPEKMGAVFVNDFYYTGDRAAFDETGLWWFEGRADDVIKSSDYRIGPFEVENALLEHPAVSEATVVGAPDPLKHQLVKAYIILNPGYTGSKDLARELFKHTMNILPKFKIPRIIEFVKDVPKTMTGKVRRIALRENETTRKEETFGDTESSLTEYFYWDFPELSSKNI